MSKQLHRIEHINAINVIDAERLKETILSLPSDERDRVIADLKVALADRLAAQAATDAKITALAKIAAAKETVAGRHLFELMEGTLRRGGLPPIAWLVDKPKHEIDKLLASSTMTVTDRMSLKTTLYRLGVYPK